LIGTPVCDDIDRLAVKRKVPRPAAPIPAARRPGPSRPTASAAERLLALQQPAGAQPWQGSILDLQRAAGNSAIGSLLAVQRDPPATADAERQRIETALQSKDPGDVKAIKEVNRATESEKIELLSILAYQGWAGIRDEWKMEEIWRSFGDQVPRVMAANRPLWTQCMDKGADLDELPITKRLRTSFMTDVQSLAFQYLRLNRQYVQHEMSELGVDDAGPTPEQDEQLRLVQQTAAHVRDARARERELGQLVVGDQYMSPDDSFPFWFRKRFDPDSPPDRNLDKDEGDKERDWAKVKAVWDPIARFISTVANEHPSIYAAIAQSDSWSGGKDNVSPLAAEQDPAKARRLVAASLQEVLKNIDGAQVKIAGNDPDYRDLIPIHAHLVDGSASAPSGTDWKQDLNRWVIDHELHTYQVRQFWVRLGLQTIAAAAFVVVEFATAGTATFFIAAGAGLAATGTMAYTSIDKFLALEQAAKSTVKDDTRLVDQAQVTAAGVQAIEDATQFLALAMAVGIKMAAAPRAGGGKGAGKDGGGEGGGGEGGGGGRRSKKPYGPPTYNGEIDDLDHAGGDFKFGADHKVALETNANLIATRTAKPRADGTIPSQSLMNQLNRPRWKYLGEAPEARATLQSAIDGLPDGPYRPGEPTKADLLAKLKTL